MKSWAAFLLCATLVLGDAIGAVAQATDARAEAPIEEILLQGFALVEAWRFKEAEALFEDALMRTRDRGLPRLEGEARRGRGAVLIHDGDLPAARTELQQARRLFEGDGDAVGVARVRGHLAVIALRERNLKEARALWEQALLTFEAAGDRVRQAETLRSLCFVGQDMTERLSFIERAANLLPGTGDRRLEGRVLQVWGDLLFSAGELQRAQQKMEAAAVLLAEVGDQPSLARVSLSLGRLQRRHGQHERALEYNRQALGIQEKLNDRLGMYRSLNAIGESLSNLGRERESVGYFERSLTLAREVQSYVPEALGALGSSLARTGDVARGVALLEEALRITTDLETDHQSSLAWGLFRLGRQEDALRHATEAVDVGRSRGERDQLRRALTTRALIREKQGQLEAAQEDARAALAVIEDDRVNALPGDRLKRGYGDEYEHVYDVLVRLLDALGRHQEALETAEMARGRAFLDLLAARDPQAATVPGAASLAQILEAAKRLDSALVSYWVGSHATIAWVVRPDGSIRRHPIAVSARTLARLVESASSGLAGPASRGAPSEDVPSAEPEETDDPVAPAPPLQALKLALRGGGTVTLDTGSLRASRRLYDLLVRPLRHDLPSSPGARLTIVGHGPLLKLSFAGLQDDKGRYLLESYALHYTPAIGVLNRAALRKGPRAAADGALLIADPALSKALAADNKLGPLAGARREAQDVVRLLRPRHVEVRMGAAAGEDRVRQAMGGKAIIHFATHGVVRDDDPDNAFLALGSDPGGTADGRLTAGEIYGLRLDADLVFLSACRTAAGQVSADGVVGLTRAFLSAGAPSVVATLWDVSDEVARDVVHAFYASLRRSGDKAAALRDAQLTVLRRLRQGKLTVGTPAGHLVLPEHPALWAGFVLQGQP
jgi:CHAT domain-containing protein